MIQPDLYKTLGEAIASASQNPVNWEHVRSLSESFLDGLGRAMYDIPREAYDTLVICGSLLVAAAFDPEVGGDLVKRASDSYSKFAAEESQRGR